MSKLDIPVAASRRQSRVSDRLLLSLGRLSLVQSRLSTIRRDTHCFPSGENIVGWCDFADHLLRLADDVVGAAARSTDGARTLTVAHGPSRTQSVDEVYVGRLVAKLEQHVRMAHILGFDTDARVDAAG